MAVRCKFITTFQRNKLLRKSVSHIFSSPICTTTVITTTTCTSTKTTTRSYSRAAWRVLTLKYTRSWRETVLFIYKTGFHKCKAGSCFFHEPFTLQWVWVISQKCVIVSLQGEILLMVIGVEEDAKNFYNVWHFPFFLFIHRLTLNICFVNVCLNQRRQKSWRDT